MTLPVLHNDKNYKVEYNPESHKVRFDRNWIGPQTSIALETAPYGYANSNSIFCSISGSLSWSGTIEQPCLTLTQGANDCTAAKEFVVVTTSGLISGELSGICNDNFQGIYAASGVVVSYTHRTLGLSPSNANAIYVAKSGAHGNPGTSDSPKLSVKSGVVACSNKYVVIQDSGTYDEGQISLSGNCLGIVAALGQAPKITFSETDLTHNAIAAGSIINFNEATTNYIAADILTTGNIVICWQDVGDSARGHFKIITTAGVEVKAETTFETGETSDIDVAALIGGGFVIVYTDVGDSNRGKQVIYDNTGTLVTAIAQKFSSSTFCQKVCALEGGGFAVAGKNFASLVYTGQYAVFNATGTLQGSIQSFTTDVPTDYGFDICSMAGGGFGIAYCRYTSAYASFFKAYDSAGTQQTSLANYAAGENDYFAVKQLANGNLMIAYRDVADGHYGKYYIYDSSYNTVVSETGFTTYHAACMNIVELSTGDAYIVFQDVYSAGKGQLVRITNAGVMVGGIHDFHNHGAQYVAAVIDSSDVIYCLFSDVYDSNYGRIVKNTDISYDGITVTAAATLNGITFDGEDQEYFRRMFTCTAKLTARWCDFKDLVDADNLAFTPALIYTTADSDIQYCKIHGGEDGIYAQANTATIKNNLVYGNSHDGIYIKGTAATPGAITVVHNSIFDNYTGLQLEDNHGTNETVKDNIFSENNTFDIYAETAMTTTYSVVSVAKCVNVTAGTGCTAANPLFVNTGAYDEDDTDLHLKLRVLGDYSDSPAYQLADDTSPDRDAGAWDSIPIGAATTWSSITIPKPPTGIEINYEPVGSVLTRLKTGEISSRMDALSEIYTIKHDGISNANFELLLDLLTCGNNLIRFYGDPVTHPDDYLTCRIIYEKTKGFSKLYRLARTGRQDVTLSFGRAYE